jgi:hypothetical protein
MAPSGSPSLPQTLIDQTSLNFAIELVKITNKTIPHVLLLIPFYNASRPFFKHPITAKAALTNAGECLNKQDFEHFSAGRSCVAVMRPVRPEDKRIK